MMIYMKTDIPNSVSELGLKRVSQFLALASQHKSEMAQKFLDQKLVEANLPNVSTPVASFKYNASESDLNALCFAVCGVGGSTPNTLSKTREEFCQWDKDLSGKPGEKMSCPFTLTEWKRGLEAQESMQNVTCGREGFIKKSIVDCYPLQQLYTVQAKKATLVRK